MIIPDPPSSSPFPPLMVLVSNFSLQVVNLANSLLDVKLLLFSAAKNTFVIKFEIKFLMA